MRKNSRFPASTFDFAITRSFASLLVMGLALSARGAEAAPAPAPARVLAQAVEAAKSSTVDTSTQVTQPPRDSTVSITKVVGEVGDRFVTSREVRVNAAIEQAFREKPSTEKGYAIPDPTDRSFAGETSKVLDEWAVYFEAKSLGSVGVSKSEVARVVGQVQERWGNHGEWASLEVGPDEVRQFVERKLLADDFQKLKSDPALSPISDEEALSYYKKNRMRFGTLPFSSFKENIKQFLQKSQIERRLSEWHEILRRKYKTRNFISG